MTKFKRAISLLTATAISLSFCLSVSAAEISDTFSEQKVYPEKVTNIIELENMGDITSETPLLNSDGETVAYCLECTSGYMIYDMNGDIVEYSPTNESPYANIDSDAYYGGPLSYIAEENGNFIDINTNIEVDRFDFETSEKINDYTTDLNDYEVSAFSMSISTLALSNGNGTIETLAGGFPRLLNYNTSKYCGALAATQLFIYIDDYINSNALTSYYTNNPINLYNYLTQLIPYNTSGTNLYQGMNKAMNSGIVNLNYTAVGAGYQDVWGLAYYLINTQKMPSILLIHNHPDLGNHWVVTYGVIACYYNNKLVDKFFIVNNGYGKNSVRINVQYQYNLIYLS